MKAGWKDFVFAKLGDEAFEKLVVSVSRNQKWRQWKQLQRIQRRKAMVLFNGMAVLEDEFNRKMMNPNASLTKSQAI